MLMKYAFSISITRWSAKVVRDSTWHQWQEA
jgi:hypothetical protein